VSAHGIGQRHEGAVEPLVGVCGVHNQPIA
jgi:hypothetical protein